MSGTLRKIMTLSALSLLAAGCGLKGPLHSPDEKQETVGAPESSAQIPGKRPAVPAPAPQSQKKDRQQKGSATNQPSTDDTASPTSPPDPDRPANSTPVPPPDRSSH